MPTRTHVQCLLDRLARLPRSSSPLGPQHVTVLRMSRWWSEASDAAAWRFGSRHSGAIAGVKFAGAALRVLWWVGTRLLLPLAAAAGAVWLVWQVWSRLADSGSAVVRALVVGVIVVLGVGLVVGVVRRARSYGGRSWRWLDLD